MNMPPMPQSQDNQQKPNGAMWMTGLIVLLTFIWVVAGIAAFIMSIICFGRSGTAVQQLIGLLLAFLFGPFYWIYYGVVKDYCGPTKSRSRK